MHTYRLMIWSWPSQWPSLLVLSPHCIAKYQIHFRQIQLCTCLKCPQSQILRRANLMTRFRVRLEQSRTHIAQFFASVVQLPPFSPFFSFFFSRRARLPGVGPSFLCSRKPASPAFSLMTKSGPKRHSPPRPWKAWRVSWSVSRIVGGWRPSVAP